MSSGTDLRAALNMLDDLVAHRNKENENHIAAEMIERTGEDVNDAAF